jgi:UPF0716 protein FxsA
LDIPSLDMILKLLRANVPKGIPSPNIDPGRLGSYIAIWIGLEILAFSLVVHSLGFLATLVLALATTMLGLSDFRRLFTLGRRGNAGENRYGWLQDGGLSALGAFLLILPGFVSDLAGLALKSPSVRAGLAKRWDKSSGSNDLPGDSAVIDLSPNDYKNLERPERPVRRRRAGSTR